MENLPVRISFCWVFSDDVTPEEGLRRLRHLGFEGIELWPASLDAFGPDRWAAALRQSGMRCFQLCPYFDFVHGEERIESSRRMLREYLAAARVVDCQRLRVFTGPPWGEGIVGAHEASEDQWQAGIRGLQGFCDEAARDGVDLCLECHEGSLMEDAPSALRLLQGVNRPNLTVNLQLPMRDEDWSVSLEALAHYTTHIHIHNWTRELGSGELTSLGQGHFDWFPVVRYLTQSAGRQVCLSVEHGNHSRGHDPWETAAQDGPFLNRLRDRLLVPQPSLPLMYERPGPVGTRFWKEMYDQGIRVFHVDATCACDIYSPDLLAWPEPDRFDYSAQEDGWRRLLSDCPDARLCLRLYAGSPEWWDAAHPEELQQYADGSTDRTFKGTPRRTIPSLASEAWRRDALRSLAAFLDWLKASGWDQKVWGIVIGFGITWEWGILGSDGFPDYSEPMRRRFRAWLQDQYTTVEKLRDSWGSEAADFETAEIPSLDARLHSENGFRIFPQDRPAFDFQRCLSDTNVDYLTALAETIRNRVGRPFVLGAFYGYTLTARETTARSGMHGPGGLQGGQHSLDRVLASNLLDFLASPYTYGNRSLEDGLLLHHFPVASVQAHGLGGHTENDLWSFTNPTSGVPGLSLGSTATLDESSKHQRLVLGHSLSNGTSYWWTDLLAAHGEERNRSSFSDPALRNELGQHARMFERLSARAGRSAAQIALVIDESSVDALGLESRLFLEEVYEQLPRWGWCGAPFDAWLASDVTTERMRPYRLVYVFAPYMDDFRWANLRRGICHSGRTIWWGTATGLLTDKGTDLEAFQALTGFKDPDAHPDLPVALDRGAWTSLYGPCSRLDAVALSKIASQAGVFLYGDAPLQVMASERLVCVHARDEGDYALRFPGEGQWENVDPSVFDGQPLGGGRYRFTRLGVGLFERK